MKTNNLGNVPEGTPYCKKCGREMLGKHVGAETVTVEMFNGLDGTKMILGHAFDSKTGKRNFTTLWRCPNYVKNKWWGGNGHDNYCDEKIINI
jgi:hypothetical protein